MDAPSSDAAGDACGLCEGTAAPAPEGNAGHPQVPGAALGAGSTSPSRALGAGSQSPARLAVHTKSVGRASTKSVGGASRSHYSQWWMSDGHSTTGRTTHISSPSSRSKGIGKSLSVSRTATQRQGRRWKVWVVLAATTLSVQVTLNVLAGDVCYLGTSAEWNPVAYINSEFISGWIGVALLGIVLDHGGRFYSDVALHRWTRRWALLNVFIYVGVRSSFMMARCTDFDDDTRRMKELLLTVVNQTCWFAQVIISSWLCVLKVRDLGRPRMAMLCVRLLQLNFVVILVCLAVYNFMSSAILTVILFACGVLCYLCFLLAAVWAMFTTARRAELSLAGKNEATEESRAIASRLPIQWTYLTAAVSLMSGLWSVGFPILILFWYSPLSPPSTLEEVFTQTIWVMDQAINCGQTALLSGLVGPASMRGAAKNAFHQLAELGGFCLHDAPRVTFKGCVSDRQERCIASFPGECGDLWERVTRWHSQGSVACVFLTDTQDGLGQHCRDPDSPTGGCYCKSIYPPFDSSAYLRILPKPKTDEEADSYPQRATFAKADAAAMGIELLEEAETPRWAWGLAKSRAKARARRLCAERGALAPWGCQWFAEWVANVEKAAKSQQELIVFYKQGRVGRGRLPWEELSDIHSVHSASETSGLGASQRVEVAYLERRGLPYTSYDVADFEVLDAGLPTGSLTGSTASQGSHDDQAPLGEILPPAGKAWPCDYELQAEKVGGVEV